jgi:ectoine hydroxylase-related dioxygenase (phytanoyl-CoA dioxygenase family)
VLTRSQRTTFEERGVLELRGAVEARVATDLRERVQAFVAERRLEPSGVGVFRAIHAAATAPLMKTLDFEKVWGSAVLAVIDDLLGPGRWQRPKHAGQLLALYSPHAGATWRLPHASWHLDYMAPGAARTLPGVQVFLCVDRIEPRAGATLMACGSHRLIDALRRRNGPAWPGRSADVRKQLQREVPWLRALWSPEGDGDPSRTATFMERETTFDGVDLRVIAAAGDPGDVFVMHPWMLHAASPNCGARPRMGLTERIHRLGEA